MTIKNDIQTFVNIFSALEEDELQTPVTKSVESEVLFEQLDLALSDEGMEDEAFNKTLKDLILSTPKTASKRFFNQLFGGRSGKGVLGELLAVVLNNSMYTYKIGGAQIGVEKEVIKQICQKIGYAKHENCGGTFAAGGSMSNFMAVLMARDAIEPEIRKTGISRTLIAYSSTESHYSLPKNIAFAGIGRENIRYIATDDQGRMRADLLAVQIERDIADGLTPFFVNATSGTTVLGAYDDIDAIADICEPKNIWLHVDGAYGGAVMLSEKYKHLLKGIERSDSYAFCAHKMLSVPLSCSTIIVKDKKYLYQSFSNDADYLYQGDNDNLNPGKISLQCGRRNDALKFWTLWKSVGSKGLGKTVDHEFELSQKAHDYISSNSDYKVYSHTPSVAVCFNYKDHDPIELCTQLHLRQKLVVGYGSFGETTFIRLVCVNSNNEDDDVLNFFKILENFSKEIS